MKKMQAAGPGLAGSRQPGSTILDADLPRSEIAFERASSRVLTYQLEGAKKMGAEPTDLSQRRRSIRQLTDSRP